MAAPGPSAPAQTSLHISDTRTTSGSQAVTGIVHGNVTLVHHAAASAPQPPKPLSTVPFQRDPDFVDRGDILARVHRRCSQPSGRAALVGLGGVGKSQLAIEYAYRVRERSPDTWVFWVFASNTTRFVNAFKAIADRLALPGRDDSATDVTKLVISWLSNENNGKWLMIVDNIDDLETLHADVGGSAPMSIAGMVPQSTNGRVLITSRNINVAREMAVGEGDIIRVTKMEDDEALMLLNKKLVRAPDVPGRDLLVALDYFPLAITQAAAFINRQPGMTVSRYISRLRAVESKKVLLERSFADMRRYEKAESSILRTWQISFEQIRFEKPGAADLLSFMSFFNRQGIPKFMLPYYKSELDSGNTIGDLGGQLARIDLREDNSELEEYIAILDSFSLISATTDTEFEMHGLVQFAVRSWLRWTWTEEECWERFLSAMERAFPRGNDYKNWATCRALLPHTGFIEEGMLLTRGQAGEWALLLGRVGLYYLRQGLFSQAESLMMMTIEKCKQLGVPDNLDTTHAMEVLSQAQRHLGKLDAAEATGRRVVAASEKELGNDDLGTVTSVSKLALILRDQGKYDMAEKLSWRVLETRERVLGKDNSSTLSSVNDLASVFLNQKKYELAERMYQRVVEGLERVLGKDHPDTLMSVNNLSMALQRQGKYEGAKPLQQRALDGFERVLGMNHPDTLNSVMRLAKMLCSTGKLQEACPLIVRAIRGYTSTLGEDHPATVRSQKYYADVKRELALKARDRAS